MTLNVRFYTQTSVSINCLTIKIKEGRDESTHKLFVSRVSHIFALMMPQWFSLIIHFCMYVVSYW